MQARLCTSPSPGLDELTGSSLVATPGQGKYLAGSTNPGGSAEFLRLPITAVERGSTRSAVNDGRKLTPATRGFH